MQPQATNPTATPNLVASNIYSFLIGLAGLGGVTYGLVQTWPTLTLDGILYAVALAVLGVVLGAVGATFSDGTYLGLEATSYYAGMMALNPWASGFIAIWPNVRWAIVNKKSMFDFLRNAGMYTLMAMGGALAYDALAGADLGTVTPRTLLALIVAIVVVRLINDSLIWIHQWVRNGWAAAVRSFLNTQREAWAVEAITFLPTVLTTLIWSQVTIRLMGLGIWLILLVSGALALYGLARARTQVTRRVADLHEANERMATQSARETALAERLRLASVDLAGYASRLASALLQQHTAITQITSTVDELAQQAQYIAEAAGAVDSTSEAALSTAGRGQEAAAGSVAAMEELERHVLEMNERMTTLESRSRLIHRTLQTINGIAEETHLLALNATIEAAGAGESGRRFNVVATQINALADQALRAAGEIQVTVREIEAATVDTKNVIERGLQETRRYTGQVDEARRSMEGILNAVGKASDMAQQIRLATQQQTQASSQVSDAMREIAGSMGTASAEGTAVSEAANGLRRLADELRRLDEQEPLAAGG